MRKMQSQKIIVNSNFDFRVANVYKAARKQQGTVKRRSFYIDETEVSPSEWANAKMDGYDTAVSNASVKGDVQRLVHKRGFDKRGFSYLKGKNYAIKPIDSVELEVVTLDEILEIVPELV